MFLSSNRGATMLTTIVLFSAVLGTLTLVTTHLLKRLKSTQVNSEYVLDSRAFITSFMDYTVLAIKERWCMNESWMRSSTRCQPNSSKPSAAMIDAITYDYNLERLLWTQTSKDEMQDLLKHYGVPNPKSYKILLEKIPPIKIDLKNITGNHPLSQVVGKISKCLSSINVEAFRPASLDQVSEGDAVKLFVKVVGNTSTSIKGCPEKIESLGLFEFIPRPLHSFSLIKIGDLDASTPFHFYGPVYVEKDLILPTKDSATGATFYNSLVLGLGGEIKTKDKAPYTFQKRGDPSFSFQDRYPEIPAFGGFKRGVIFDPRKDDGLAALFGNVNVQESKATNKCLERLNLKTNLLLTKDSKLWVKAATSSKNKLTGIIGLSNKDEFISLVKKAECKKELDEFLNCNVDNKKDLTTKLQINFGQKDKEGKNIVNLFADMAPSVPVTYKVNFSQFIEELKYKLELLESELGKEIKELQESLKKECRDAPTLVKKIFPCNSKSKTILNDEKCKEEFTPDKDEKDKDKITKLEEERKKCLSIVDLNQQIKDKEKALQEQEDDLKKQIANLENLNKNKPQLEIKIDNIGEKDQEVSNQVKLSIDLKNWENLKKSNLFDGEFFLNFQPMDFVSDLMTGGNKRSGTDGPNAEGVLNTIAVTLDGLFLISKDKKSINSNLWQCLDCPLGNTKEPETILNSALNKECETTEAMPIADWNISFLASTKDVWNYTTNNPLDTDNRPQGKKIFSQGTQEGQIREKVNASLIGECIIESDVDQVFGHYVCKQLTIKPRTTNLNLIGSWIVENLDQTTVTTSKQVKVNFYSYWEDYAVKKLQDKNLLEKNNCGASRWSITNQQGNIRCSPISLIINGADNFTWQTVDPRIGPQTSNGTRQAKITGRYDRWVVRTIDRKDMIQ